MAATRYALIGSGMMGQEHIRNLALIEGAEVTAIADPDPGMRAAAAELAGPRVRAFDDPHDMLAADLADALVIVTPNHTHVDFLMPALATGLPILVEKPLCTTVEDCRRVIDAAAGRTAPVWVAIRRARRRTSAPARMRRPRSPAAATGRATAARCSCPWWAARARAERRSRPDGAEAEAAERSCSPRIGGSI